ncbi:MAG TPA: DUF4328 domain-containing protein [Solirubrobacterales bacterium]|nr:DUF4328 domain-containing protein [Solirubrobacterales bacterium]
MEPAGPAVARASHRVADPKDPPREMSGLAWGAMVCLGLVGALLLAKTVAALHLRSIVKGGGDITAAYGTYSVWVSFYGLFVLIAAGVFIAWFFRAYKNLHRLGVQGVRYGTGWAIGAWFIPIFGMIRPKQIANDVWRGSERGIDVSAQWRQIGIPRLLQWWWGLFLTQGLLVEIGQRMTASGYNRLVALGPVQTGFSRIESGTFLELIGGLCGLAAVFLAIKVVSRISQRLDGIREDVLLSGNTGLQPALQ